MIIPELSVHIVQRGHDGDACFFEEADYHAYIDLLSTFAGRCGCSVHAFCLMTNHVHILLTPHAPDSCARLMKNVGQRYVQRVNARLGRSGTLWEGRFFSCLVPGSDPAEYPWSSYRINVDAARPSWLIPHAAYLAISENAEGRAAAYRELCAVPLSTEARDEIRRATRRGLAVGAPERRRVRRS